jgi:hypothetical protein
LAPPVEVDDKDGRKVRAKMLVDAAGRYVRDPMTGMPLIVDEDFDMDRAIAFGRSLANIPETGDDAIAKRAEIYKALYDAFVPGGPLEMQRSYNGMVGGSGHEFVRMFRPAASYVLGVVGRAAGLSPLEIMTGGGAQNLWGKYNPENPHPYLDTSGPMGNAPQNARWIEEGMRGHDSGRFFKSAPGQQGGTDQTQGERVPAEDSIRGGQPPQRQEQPPMPNFAAAGAQPTSPQMTPAAQPRADQQVALTAAPGLPEHVIATGNYLRANGYEITPRTMYVSHVLGPQAAVDLFKRTGSTSSDAVPSPDAATGDQMRAWARQLRLGPAASAGVAGGMAPAADVGPAIADQSNEDPLAPNQPVA